MPTIEEAEAAKNKAEKAAKEAREAKEAAEAETQRAKEAEAAAQKEAKEAKAAKDVAEAESQRAKEAEAAAREELESNIPVQAVRELKTSRIWFVFGGVAFVILAIIYVVFFSGGPMLKDLKDVSYARGLITFIFSIGTIGIALILTLAALRPGKDAGEAFIRGKEIFTILVGILGTIVGFYFGSGTDLPPQSQLNIAEIGVSTQEPNENGELELSALITGGEPPYEVVISFEPDVVDLIEITSSMGELQRMIKLPSVDKDTPMFIEVSVSDRAGGETRSTIRDVMIKNTD